MTVRRLIKAFEALDRPVEVEEIRGKILEWGYYHEIDLEAFDKPPGRLQGTFIQYESVNPDGTREFCVIIYHGAER